MIVAELHIYCFVVSLIASLFVFCFIIVFLAFVLLKFFSSTSLKKLSGSYLTVLVLYSKGVYVQVMNS